MEEAMDSQRNEPIEIPVPSDQQQLTAPADLPVEVEEVQQPGHFSVDYRRC